MPQSDLPTRPRERTSVHYAIRQVCHGERGERAERGWKCGPVELADGLRLRLAVDDWEKLRLDVGRRIPVRLFGADVWLFNTHATELPPIVWVMMAKRVRAAG